jgi:hypothetical protein
MLTDITYFQGYIDELSLDNGVASSCEILEMATLAASFTFDGSSPLQDQGPNSVSSQASNYTFVTGQMLQAISLTGEPSSFFQAWGFLALGIPNQPFSFSLWIQPQSLSGTILQLSTNASGTGSCIPFMGFSSNGTLIVQVKTNTSFVAASYFTLQLNTFSHVVQTWSITNGLQLYVNAVLVSSAVASSYLASSASVNYLTVGNCLQGCTNCSTTPGNKIVQGPFAGAVDQVQVYSREITASDVCNLFVHT